MKIVDRTTFLAMPANTLFSKYEPCFFGDLQIKGDNAGDNDFFVQEVADALEFNDTQEFADILFKARETGSSFVMDFDCEQRDGCFDSDQLFAVWEKSDVEALIERLKKCL